MLKGFEPFAEEIRKAMAFWSSRQHMGWATLLMGVSVLLSRFMGLIRDKIISYFFGATTESDIYFAAFVIPDFINYLLAGAYFSITLIPLLAAYFEKDTEEGWRFFSAVFTWVAFLITVFTLAAALLAPWLATLAAPGLPKASLARLVYFLRIVMPAQIFFLLGSCLTALLYMRKQFFVPALTPLIYNFFIIIGGVLLRDRGMEGFCWGVLAGALVGFALLPAWAAHKGGGMRLRPCLWHPGLKRFAILALPFMIGQSVVVLDEQLVRIFGSLTGESGAVSWLNYARRIMLVPVGVVAQAAGVASYPFLAELVARREFPKFNATLNTALRHVLFLLIPLSLWMMVVAEPTIRLVFQQGHFNPGDTRETSYLLRISLTVVFCWGIQQILGRGFYARQDTLTPSVLGTLVTAAAVPLYIWLTRQQGVAGVAAASALSIGLYAVALVVWWWYRFGGSAFDGITWFSAKALGLSALAAAPSAVPVALHWPVALRWMDAAAHPYISAILQISLSGAAFVFVFLVISTRAFPAELEPLLKRLGPLGKRFERKT